MASAQWRLVKRIIARSNMKAVAEYRYVQLESGKRPQGEAAQFELKFAQRIEHINNGPALLTNDLVESNLICKRTLKAHTRDQSGRASIQSLVGRQRSVHIAVECQPSVFEQERMRAQPP